MYYYRVKGPQFWMFTLYDKDEAEDLSSKERVVLSEMLREVIKLADR